MGAALLERAFDLLRRNQRARRVVHTDVLRTVIDAIQASPNGILPTFPTPDNRADFFEPCTANEFCNFIMLLFTRHNHDFAYRSRALERADCVSDYWFSGNYGKQFIESHALATAAGDDDRAQHGTEKKRPTSNVQRPISQSECSHSALGVFLTLVAFALLR
jgi:hypothetical protein